MRHSCVCAYLFVEVPGVKNKNKKEQRRNPNIYRTHKNIHTEIPCSRNVYISPILTRLYTASQRSILARYTTNDLEVTRFKNQTVITLIC
ncbi:MAG: hypothetical protein LiPW41_230 [Parcubacteria group bacterium LiPW_41]|nr:MAG: hypothetical protein LiPW41_230 [Parcubacteria group bacterium LiPW_41]